MNGNSKEIAKREIETKQQALSFISSVFDPCGYASPYILDGRHFFQLINQSGIGWKDKIPEEILTPFLKWKNSIVHLKNLRIDRWTNLLGLEDSRCDLAIFCDGSQFGHTFVL